MNGYRSGLRGCDGAVVLGCILLALLMLGAVGTTGREAAKAFVCQSNLRQLGGAMSLFLNDNDDRYPNPWLWLVETEAPVAGYQRFCRWHDPRYPPDGPLWAYLAKEKVALCPTVAGFAKELLKNHPSHDGSIPVEPQYSYSMNVFLGTRNAAPGGGVLKSAEVTRSKAQVFVLAEENLWQRPGCLMTYNDTALCGDGRDWFGTFHNIPSEDWNSGTIHAVFADGHVQKVRSALITTEDNQMDLRDAEYGRFEKFAWPLDTPPR